MTDRPILFSAPMVRALLAGRKTQTRRVLGKTGHANIFEPGVWSDGYVLDPGNASWRDRHIPIKTGDRLWVREAVRAEDDEESWDHGIRYLADDAWARAASRDDVSSDAYGRWWLLNGYRSDDPDITGGKAVPSIHMPRWASRLTLTITEVRVQRLQDISEEDARAEGVECDSDGWRDYLMPATQCCASATDSYRTLWDSINGAGSWAANPWCAAYTFTVERRNIDAPSSQGGQPDV